MKIARCSCTCRLKESCKPSSTSSCRRIYVEHSEIKYNTMCRFKTKLILLKFRFLKTYEAWARVKNVRLFMNIPPNQGS
jgi:hypothetical protein